MTRIPQDPETEMRRARATAAFVESIARAYAEVGRKSDAAKAAAHAARMRAWIEAKAAERPAPAGEVSR